MRDLLDEAADVLREAAYSTRAFEVAAPGRARPLQGLAFEDDTVMGFVIAYSTPNELVLSWKADGTLVAQHHHSSLQSAQQKAWNTYFALLAQEEASLDESLLLGFIEEDLEGMRKIAQAGVGKSTSMRKALLALLPFRAAPLLDPVDIRTEILARTSELDRKIVDTFLSSAEEALVLQLLEDEI